MHSPDSHAVSDTMRTKRNTRGNKKASQASRGEIAQLRKQLSKLSTRKHTPFADSGSKVGSSVAKMLGMNASAGADWGRWAGSGVGKIFGSGSYKFTSPNSVWNVTNQVPVVHSSSETINFCHREYLGEVSSTSAYTIQQTYSLNPGLTNSFPYLSAIAQSFQEYRFKGLVFEFKSTSADALNSTNTALGTIMMVAQYRADAPAPTNKIELLNEMWSCDTKPSLNLFLPIECNPDENPLKRQYIRTTTLTSVQDAKFYDLGTVFVASQGSQATATVGEMWVTYDVELSKPSLASSASSYAANTAHFECATVTTASPFGGFVQSYNNMGVVITSAGLVTFPVLAIGTQLFITFHIRAATSSTDIVTNIIANASIMTYFLAGDGRDPSGSGTTYQSVITAIKITGTAAASLNFTSTIVGAATSELWITGLPNDLES